jgi:hypothetical protein
MCSSCDQGCNWREIPLTRFFDGCDKLFVGLVTRENPEPALTSATRDASHLLEQHGHLRNALCGQGGLGTIQDVVKIDPRGLVLRQFDINLDIANEHAANIQAQTWCARTCLATERTANLNFNTIPNGWNFALPHGEFLLAFNGQAFGIIQGAPHVSVSTAEARTILWAGYHRCYARAATVNPEIMDRSVLAALTTEGTFAVAPESTNQLLRELVLGERPPLLGDFFDERLFMEVELRRKRYELQVRVEVARIDA